MHIINRKGDVFIKFNWLTPQIILTGYASCISTIALVWNIVIAIINQCSRLKVNVQFRDTLTASPITGETIAGPKILFIRIVNKGTNIKYVSNITIKMPYKTSIGDDFSLVNLNTKFPIELSPQQEYVYKFQFINRPELMLENFYNGKCYVIVLDTIKKKYRSNRFTADHVKKAFEHNTSLKPEIITLFNEIK